MSKLASGASVGELADQRWQDSRAIRVGADRGRKVENPLSCTKSPGSTVLQARRGRVRLDQGSDRGLGRLPAFPFPVPFRQ